MDNNIISALGGGSGIDTTKLVKNLVELERAPQQQRLDSRKEKLDAQISAYGTLKSSLAEFKKMLAPLTNKDTFNARSVSFPETDVITPNTLGANAQTGTYQISVESIAKSHSLVVNHAVADRDASLGASGNLTIRQGTWSYSGSQPDSFSENEARPALTIAVQAGDSLSDIADKINAQEGEVQASVLQVNGSYQLLLSAQSGAHNALEISADDASLNGFAFNASQHSGVTETQQGQDAHLKLNGLSVYRASNEVNDVIKGLDLSLNKASPGEQFTFSISADKNSGEQAIRDFVEAYNTFYATAKNLTGISRDAETNQTTRGDLATDGSAKSLFNRLRSALTDAVPGVGSFNALTNIGVRTKLDGTLEIIEKEFSAAMQNQYGKVADLFAQTTRSSSGSLAVSVGSYAGKTVPGTYEAVVTTAPSKGKVVADTAFSSFDTASTPAGDFSFSVNVDGVSSDTLTLQGNFTSVDELKTALQGLINNDSAIKEANIAIDVQVGSGGVIELVSREFGSDSKVRITSAGADFASATGLSPSSVTSNGVDVAGTINGVAAFGAGNVLLPKLDTDAYGLNLQVDEGATGTFSFTFSRGLGGELSQLLDSFMANDGTIKNREESINRQLKGIGNDQENLDRKMEAFQTRLTAQYLAMERIIASFKTTGNSLDGILDRLPFTASKN